MRGRAAASRGPGCHAALHGVHASRTHVLAWRGVVQADLRITVRPLVEKIPVAGGVTISLLRVPVVEAKVCLIKGIDLMALPGVPQLLNFGLKVRLNVCKCKCMRPQARMDKRAA